MKDRLSGAWSVAAALAILCASSTSSNGQTTGWLSGAKLFTDATLAKPGVEGTYIDRSLEDITADNDWRESQTVAGTRVDTNLSFTTGSWGERATVGITGGNDENWDNFSVQWDGYIQVLEAGQRFATASDDGSRMWIDLNQNSYFEREELVDNGWGRDQGVTVGDRSPALPTGAYRIRIQYFEGGGDNEFHLASSPFVPRAFVPSTNNPRQLIRVLVLNFEPRIPSEGNRRLWEVFGWTDPRLLAKRFKSDLEWATGGAVELQVVVWRDLDEFPRFTDGFRYNPEEYVQNRRSGTGWHDGGADFYFLAEKQNLAALVNSNQIDEIWCFGDHFFGLFGEAWMAGPNAFFINGPSFPNIGFDRAIAGYGFNYERSVAEMLHNLSHRTENHGQRAYGGWNLANPITAFDKFSANYLDSPGRIAGVGTCHVPANADSHYDYANTRVVESTALDWPNYPSLTSATSAVGRDTYGCGPAPDYHRDYMNFYFGMMPRNTGTSEDGRQANWFKYIWDFNSYEDGTGLARDNDAFAAGDTVKVAGGADGRFTVRFYDQTGVNTATIDSNDVEVRGPNGFVQVAALVNVGQEVATIAGTARTVTYHVNPPGGAWDIAANGSYRIYLRSSQVQDTLGDYFPSSEIGGFQVNMPDPSQINLASMLSTGDATVTHTSIDIGPILNLFDGNVDSLIRTPDIDPAVVTLAFTQAQTIYGFATYFSYASGDPALQWQAETADTQEDLDNRTGSWRQALPITGTAPNRSCRVMLSSPITARLARLTATKLYGDDYVHINEWQLLGASLNDTTPPVAAGSSTNVLGAGPTAHFITVEYSDASGVEVGSLDSTDLLITGPNGFETNAVFYGVDSHLNGPARAATYWFIPPTGRWDSTGNGKYTITLRSSEVMDILRQASASDQVLGSFTVEIPPPVHRPASDLAETNSSLWIAGTDGATAALTNDADRKTSGASSILFTTDGGSDAWLRFPPAAYADWDLRAASLLYFSVFAVNTNGSFQDFWVRLNGTDGGWFDYRCTDAIVINNALGSWETFTIPLAGGTSEYHWVRTTNSSPSLQHISSVEFHADTWGSGFQLWFDRVGFDLPAGPMITIIDTSLINTNGFGFMVSDTFDRPMVVEVSTNLTHWFPIQTNVPSPSASSLFVEPQDPKWERRFYRVRLD